MSVQDLLSSNSEESKQSIIDELKKLGMDSSTLQGVMNGDKSRKIVDAIGRLMKDPKKKKRITKLIEKLGGADEMKKILNLDTKKAENAGAAAASQTQAAPLTEEEILKNISSWDVKLPPTNAKSAAAARRAQAQRDREAQKQQTRSDANILEHTKEMQEKAEKDHDILQAKLDKKKNTNFLSNINPEAISDLMKDKEKMEAITELGLIAASEAPEISDTITSTLKSIPMGAAIKEEDVDQFKQMAKDYKFQDDESDSEEEKKKDNESTSRPDNEPSVEGGDSATSAASQ